MGGSSGPSDYDRSSSRQSQSSSEKPKGGGGGGDGTKGGDPCDIALDADLTGIDPAVLAKVTVGVSLTVSIVKAGRYEAVACGLPPKNVTVGTLAAVPGLANLIACIKKKNTYVADVLQVGRGRCVVHVHRK